jgi:hypothetical protein
MMKFRKKPAVIEAVKWTGCNETDIMDFTDKGRFNDEGGLVISTLEGILKADVGDWIIKGVNGEFYPCKPDIFEKTYETL